jgi:soluble lytic murein transglycosylase-like protein
MKNWLLGFVAGTVLASYVALSCSEAHGQSVPDLIDQAAAQEGIPWAAGHLRRIAWCESKFFPGAYNRSSGASGVFQFVPQTWAWTSRAAGWAGYSPFHAAANVFCAAYLYRVGGPRHWVCA